MRVRIVLGVVAVWLLIAVVLGSQTALGTSLQGDPLPFGDALRNAFINWLPWISLTLGAVWMAVRFPLTRDGWKRRLPLHLLALLPLAWIANVLVVLGFWAGAGTFQGWGRLAQQGLFWATLRIHVAATVYLVTAAATQAWIYYRDTQDRRLRYATLEAQLARARFQALNEQIRPHFLFNTLHTIGQLWRSGRADDADAMLDHLGALFHTVRASTDRVFISLDEELEMVREYLAIEQARFSNRLVAVVEADPAARGCAVPPLLLQPLVENAIRHGISVRPESGLVVVRGAVEGGRLILEVTDDGPGPDHPSPRPGSGTGLANTRARLAHAFGDEHTLTVEARTGGTGTRVRLVLPALDEESAGTLPAAGPGSGGAAVPRTRTPASAREAR